MVSCILAAILGILLRDIDNSLPQEKLKDSPHGYIADLSASTIQCISISDTIIYWTQDDSDERLSEFLLLLSPELDVKPV
jgi:hypothetical protein